MTLAEKILQLRTQQNLSQGDLAERLEVSRQSVSKWETGQSVPDLDKIVKLADLFGVTVDQLVREGESPEPDGPQGGQEEAAPGPQVVYVEHRRKQTPLQIFGVVLLALGIGMAILGLSDGLLLLLGGMMIVLSLPLLLVKGHPLLVDGWLVVAVSWVFLNPRTSVTPLGLWGGLGQLMAYFTVPELRGPAYAFGIAIALGRGVLTLGLIWFTWRAWKNRTKQEGRR